MQYDHKKIDKKWPSSAKATAGQAEKKYDHRKIDRKWQREWDKSGLYKTKEDTKKPKCYVLDMFPYPSGEGLHVGHPKGYIATDIYSRFHSMNGKNILHPMGWDAFGLPAENYALKNKVHPEVAVKKNIKRFKEQLAKIGFNYDWSREINTTDPDFYKWTQWTFLKMFEKGLAYEAYEPINWCPSCKTGLANEDLEDGKCERCGSQVEQKPMRQWVLKITDYADRLLNDLDDLKWPDSVKEAQRNWIGRSEGAEIDFELDIKRHYVLLHGYTATPEDDFLPWLKAELEKCGHTVEVPALPNTKNPVVSEQVAYVLKNCHFDANTVLVGHSLGGVVALKVAEQLKKPLARLVLAAGFMQPRFKDHPRPFEKSFDWKFDVEKIRQHAPQVYILRAKNDSAVVAECADYIKQQIDGEIIDFTAQDNHVCGTKEPVVLDYALDKIRVFTTRADTLFGVTYVVLAPESNLVADLLPRIENKAEVKKYIAKTEKENTIDRTKANKEKTGVELKGIKVINPASGEKVPVYISDYVLASYGTGAVMAVPAHDERDFAFAKKFGLPIKEVIAPFFSTTEGKDAVRNDKPNERRATVNCIVKNWKEDKYIGLDWKKYGWKSLLIGGIEQGESAEEAGRREITEETGYKNMKYVGQIGGEVHSYYYAAHKGVNRYAATTTVYFELKNDEREEVDPSETERHEVVWVEKDQMADFLNLNNNQYTWNLFTAGNKEYTDDGVLIHSGSFDGLTSEQARKDIVRAVGGKLVVQYKLRDWVFSRQRYWGEPIPVIHCERCGVVPVPEKDLPVKLPKVKSYEPTGTGESPLAGISKWVNVKCPTCGGKGKRETNTMPQWAGSSWYYLRYIDPKNKKALVDKKKEKYWSPVDMYVGGMEHATRHLIYARFWHKFLFDIGAVNYAEPFSQLKTVGLIAAADGRKMSKRWGNVINPDDVVATYGADTLRIYEMFMGPFEMGAAWSTESMIGTRRFLDRLCRQVDKIKNQKPDAKMELLINRTVKKVGEDINQFGFNTAISTMMIAVNEFDRAEIIPKSVFETFLKILAPFAPHITEELWYNIGHKKSIHLESWPKFDPAKLEDKTVTIVIQINGKVRDSIQMETNSSEEEVKSAALKREKVQTWLGNKPLRQVIYIKNRLINIVI